MDHDGEFDGDKEREFCVRDVPATLEDWDIFHIFKKYGMIDNVRIPPNQPDQLKYGFVSMINLAGADAVRAALVNGKLMCEDLCLRVSDVKNGVITKPPKYPGYSRGNGNRSFNRSNVQQQQKKKAISYVTVDLPLGRECQVRVVASPWPIDLKKGLTFHVLNLSTVPPNEYTELQKEMNDYCQNPQNAITEIQTGEAVLYFRDNVAYRALCTGTHTLYLVDMGRVEMALPKTLYRMQEHFAVLPTLVVGCSLANVKWLTQGAEHYQQIREVINKWCDADGPLKATVHHFNGLVNMVSVVGNGTTNLKDSLARRGDIEPIEEAKPCSYDRDYMNAIREKVAADPKAFVAKIENATGILVTEKRKDVDEAMKGIAI